jgi:Dimerisation domain/O-methyltransferase domain
MAAVRLGLFEALRQGPRTPADVAAAVGLDAQGVDMVMRVLVSAGYVSSDGSRYELTPLARSSLLRGAPQPFVGLAEFTYLQWDMVAQLEQILRTGKGVDFHTTVSDSGAWAAYQRAMLEFAGFEAPLMAPLVAVRKGARRLLDVGGSHGMMGAEICRVHPGLTSEVLDLPRAVEHARELALGGKNRSARDPSRRKRPYRRSRVGLRCGAVRERAASLHGAAERGPDPTGASGARSRRYDRDLGGRAAASRGPGQPLHRRFHALVSDHVRLPLLGGGRIHRLARRRRVRRHPGAAPGPGVHPRFRPGRRVTRREHDTVRASCSTSQRIRFETIPLKYFRDTIAALQLARAGGGEGKAVGEFSPDACPVGEAHARACGFLESCLSPCESPHD